ncbi:MAG: alpha/beta hydrolase [Eubacteriales bacterium]|nr:alpha/beta hydrolase [Eubacteriales bacterium]
MKEYTNRGLKLEYETWGEGTPLIFLHGMGGSVEQIRSTCEPLSGVQMIVPNFQGHGNSEFCEETYSFASLTEDLLELVRQLGLKKYYLAGISMGAAICLRMAEIVPEQICGMLLIRNAWTEHPMSEKVQLAYHDMAVSLRDQNFAEFQKSQGWKLVEGPSTYTRNAFTGPFHEEAALRCWQKYLRLPAQAPVDEIPSLPRELAVRILACRGDFVHPFAYGEYLHRRLPGSVFTEIPNKDEDPVRHKAMINQAVRELLAE